MNSVDKISILNLIREEKEVLFGRFSCSLTHEQKMDAWKRVTEKAKAIGAFTRDWKYLRDTTWQNWRKRTIEKKDNRTKTGSAGGKKCIYDEADHIIMDIIGKESPVLEGIMAPESSGTDIAAITFAYHEDLGNQTGEVIVNNADGVAEPTCSNASDNLSGTHQTPSASTGGNTRKRNINSAKKEYELLRTKKIKLQTLLLVQKLETAKRETYKMDLELLKMEKEAGLPPSEFTAHLTNSKIFPVNTEMLQFGSSNSVIEDAIVIVNNTCENN